MMDVGRAGKKHPLKLRGGAGARQHARGLSRAPAALQYSPEATRLSFSVPRTRPELVDKHSCMPTLASSQRTGQRRRSDCWRTTCDERHDENRVSVICHALIYAVLIRRLA